MQIRAASEKDAEAISRLALAVARDAIAPGLSEPGQRALIEALSADRIRETMRSDGTYHVCEDGGELLGIVAMRAHRHLRLLFVEPRAQGKGIARALWDTARAASVAAGHSGPFTVSAAPGAVGLYERLGFVAEGPATDEGGLIRVPMRTPG